jgi:hypothetical protein
MRMQADKKKLSELLIDILAQHQGDRISVKALAHDLHKQGMPLLIAIFSIPVCLPIPYPPGFTAIIALCISVFALQMLAQRKELWLPKWLISRSIPRTLADSIIAKALPKLTRFEHLFRERWPGLVDSGTQRRLMVVVLIMNVIIGLPVPFIHFFPGWANVFICLGLLNRDGKVVALGLVLAAVGFGLAGTGLWLGGKAIEAIFGH